MFWSIIVNAITGNLGGIITAITGSISKLSDNETAKLQTAIGADKEVAIAQMQAQAAAYHDNRSFYSGMQVTQWLIAAALLPPILHQGAVFLDSIPFFWHTVGSWSIPKAPDPYADREWLMIASLLGIQSFMATGMGLTRILLKR